ncbi:hypothetical protein O5472_26240, partial [Escherichia coli]|nr:hypothetical protein [Escherichia coli]
VTLNQGREIRPIRKWIQSGTTFDVLLPVSLGWAPRTVRSGRCAAPAWIFTS